MNLEYMYYHIHMGIKDQPRLLEWLKEAFWLLIVGIDIVGLLILLGLLTYRIKL